MLKSELIQRISSRNPHLYQRDVERVVNAILDQSLKLWRAEIEWSCGVSERFPLGSAERGPAAILALELSSRSDRKPLPSSRLEKKCESDLIGKLRCRLVEQRGKPSDFFSQNLRAGMRR